MMTKGRQMPHYSKCERCGWRYELEFKNGYARIEHSCGYDCDKIGEKMADISDTVEGGSEEEQWSYHIKRIPGAGVNGSLCFKIGLDYKANRVFAECPDEIFSSSQELQRFIEFVSGARRLHEEEQLEDGERNSESNQK